MTEIDMDIAVMTVFFRLREMVYFARCPVFGVVFFLRKFLLRTYRFGRSAAGLYYTVAIGVRV